MFIRCVKTKDPKSKKEYYFYKLVENYRTERGVRQRVLLNLGHKLELPKEQWKLLADRIEQIYTGTQDFFAFPDEIEKLAQKFAKLLIHKQSQPTCINIDKAPKKTHTYTSVDLASLSTSHARSIGVEHILYETLKKLKIEQCLQKLGFTKPRINLAIAIIIARAAFPSSELRTHFFLQNKSAMDELLKTNFNHFPLYKLYEISDLLLSKKQAIEEHLKKQENSVFNLKETIVLYDLTNTYFEGLANKNSKAKYGRSKEKRSDCPLVTFGLVLDQNGFPKKSEFFEGNVAEPQTLKKVISQLSCERDLLFQPVIVMDGGLSSVDNIKWLKEHGHPYITVYRRKRKKFPKEGEWVAVKDDDGNLVKALLEEDSDERRLYCQSTARERREKRIKTKTQQRFEEELMKLKKGLTQPYYTKRYAKILEKIGKIKEKYKRIARFYEIKLTKCTKSENTLDISWELNDTACSKDFDGSYCLRTDIGTLGAKELWNLYMLLNRVEEAFREMKSELGLRPIYHQIEQRVNGHLWITLLAYHLTHSIRYQLKEAGICLSWASIKDRLSSQVRVTTKITKENQQVVHVRTTTEPEGYQREICRALNISASPLKNVETLA